MGKHVEFGKDLGLMAEVVRRGLSIGIGDSQFWGPLSKPQPGLWNEMLQFGKYATPEYISQRASWPKDVSKIHHQAPDIDTLDQVVREGRKNSFEKTEWQHLAEDGEFFEAMVAYLCLAAPFSIAVEVDYDRTPPYIGGYTSCFPLAQKKGKVRNEMSIYLPASGNLLEEEVRLRGRGWVFADQYQLYAFGQRTKHYVRPWAMMGTEPIYGLGSRNESRGYYNFPRLWTLRGNDELDPHGCSAVHGSRPSLMGDLRILIVKN